MSEGGRTSQRNHAIDSLRTTMMTLGIVLHACMNYMTPVMHGGWLYKDPQKTVLADYAVAGIHTFRMPLFYVLAGFFTALLVQRRGVSGMVTNRLVRITLPFVLFWIVIIPMASAGALFANVHSFGGSGLQAVKDWARGGHLWSDTTAHLWFLYFLTIFFLMAAVFTPILKLTPSAIQQRASAIFAWILQNPFRRLLLSLPVFVVLWFEGGVPQTRMTFEPEPLILTGYLVYYVVGWALWHHQEMLSGFTKWAGTQVAIGTCFMLWYVSLLPGLFAVRTNEALWLPVLLGGVIVWLMTFGFLGLAIRHASSEIPWMRYMTDASYYMYLVHVPLMFVIPGLLSHWQVPALVKILVTLLAGLPILVVSYHYLVRDTLIGRLLNGRRFPREWPSLRRS